MIGVADVLVLAALAFTLAVRHVKLLSLQPYPIILKGITSDLITICSIVCLLRVRKSRFDILIYPKGEMNQAYVSEGQPRSRRSSSNTVMAQPVVMFPHPSASGEVLERMPEYGTHRTGRKVSAHSYRSDYSNSSGQQRFHL